MLEETSKVDIISLIVVKSKNVKYTQIQVAEPDLATNAV